MIHLSGGVDKFDLPGVHSSGFDLENINDAPSYVNAVILDVENPFRSSVEPLTSCRK